MVPDAFTEQLLFAADSGDLDRLRRMVDESGTADATSALQMAFLASKTELSRYVLAAAGALPDAVEVNLPLIRYASARALITFGAALTSAEDNPAVHHDIEINISGGVLQTVVVHKTPAPAGHDKEARSIWPNVCVAVPMIDPIMRIAAEASIFQICQNAITAPAVLAANLVVAAAFFPNVELGVPAGWAAAGIGSAGCFIFAGVVPKIGGAAGGVLCNLLMDHRARAGGELPGVGTMTLPVPGSYQNSSADVRAWQQHGERINFLRNNLESRRDEQYRALGEQQQREWNQSAEQMRDQQRLKSLLRGDLARRGSTWSEFQSNRYVGISRQSTDIVKKNQERYKDISEHNLGVARQMNALKNWAVEAGEAFDNNVRSGANIAPTFPSEVDFGTGRRNGGALGDPNSPYDKNSSPWGRCAGVTTLCFDANDPGHLQLYGLSMEDSVAEVGNSQRWREFVIELKREEHPGKPSAVGAKYDYRVSFTPWPTKVINVPDPHIGTHAVAYCTPTIKNFALAVRNVGATRRKLSYYGCGKLIERVLWQNGEALQTVVDPGASVSLNVELVDLFNPSHQELNFLCILADEQPAANLTLDYHCLEATKAVELSSGTKPSTDGESWSPNYLLSTGQAPLGYLVGSAEFWLTGDRRCGEWATCSALSKNSKDVCYAFSLQGHNESGVQDKVRYSEGHLRVIYRLGDASVQLT